MIRMTKKILKSSKFRDDDTYNIIVHGVLMWITQETSATPDIVVNNWLSGFIM